MKVRTVMAGAAVAAAVGFVGVSIVGADEELPEGVHPAPPAVEGANAPEGGAGALTESDEAADVRMSNEFDAGWMRVDDNRFVRADQMADLGPDKALEVVDGDQNVVAYMVAAGPLVSPEEFRAEGFDWIEWAEQHGADRALERMRAAYGGTLSDGRPEVASDR